MRSTVSLLSCAWNPVISRSLVIVTMVGCIAGCSEGVRHDARAIAVLDSMGMYIGERRSASFTVETSIDDEVDSVGVVQHNRTSDVYIVGPDKIFVMYQGDRGRAAVWYNGKTVTVYSFDRNSYDQVSAPDNIIATIDSMYSVYGLEFPAADFLYPTFTSDLMAAHPDIRHVGMTYIDGRYCDHIIARNKDGEKQMWIARTGPPVPVRLLITDLHHLQYESTITNWVADPELDSLMFEFAVPEGSHKTSVKQIVREQL